MRAAIILVTPELSEAFQQKLPPEHRVTAERQRTTPGGRSILALLVEGPLMPEVPDGEQPVEGVLECTALDPVGGRATRTHVRLVALHATSGWRIGPEWDVVHA